MTDATTKAAIKIRDRLNEVATELKRRLDGLPELNRMDARTCEDAALMLEKLGTEVTRLRLGIGCYRYGRLSRVDLFAMTRNWNSRMP